MAKLLISKGALAVFMWACGGSGQWKLICTVLGPEGRGQRADGRAEGTCETMCAQLLPLALKGSVKQVAKRGVFEEDICKCKEHLSDMYRCKA